ncbi:MAG: N-acetylneuraminate synthase family protein [bacterium]|nr:N-acetylneuraminate synthase family protein [bacterium]
MNLFSKIKKTFVGLPNKVKIGKQYVGQGEPVFVIAEVGLNHNGDINLAEKLVDAACESGAQAVKFQKRTTTGILTKEGLNKPYTSPHAYGATYGEHRDKLEFNENDYDRLKKYCESKGILFFASVWDEGSADFLEKLDIDAYKIPSADTINIPLLEYVAKKKKPVLLSTGMNTLEEIDLAVQTVLKINSRVIIFHCLSLYPSPENMINLRFMDVLRERFHPLPVGYSGHEMELMPTFAAVARGATIVERHLTLDKKMKGSDHAASLEPDQFKALVNGIRQIEGILGKPERVMFDDLKPLREKLAKSVASKKSIKIGTKITQDMLILKGPGSGIPPSKMADLIGRRAEIDIDEDVIIPKSALSWKKK